MSNTNALELLEESLRDMPSSCMKFWQQMAQEQRERNSKQAGEVAFWSAIYILFLNEQRRRKQVMEKTEMDIAGIEEPIIEWTGRKEDSEKTTLQILFPETIKDPEKEDPNA